MAERLGAVASAALHREQPLPALRVTEGATDACAVLVRLFTLGRSVPVAALAAALPTLGVDGAVALGLVVVGAALPDAGPTARTRGASAGGADAEDDRWAPPGDEVLATCDLRPYGDDAHDWWVASDLSELAVGGPLRHDHVLGIGGASTTLASWTVRRPVGRALDLGTGCGVQALHLTAHAQTIVATDISRRALAYAAFNLALAAHDAHGAGPTTDLRSGDLLEPVAQERFSLVVSNPPFVITPRGQGLPLYEYRDGGRAGDTLVRALVRQVGSVLEPGGVAQFLGNWEVPAGRSWREVWAEWLEEQARDGVALDAWVVQRESQDPAEYAELWARDGGAQPGSDAHSRMYAAWLDDFGARGVEQVGFGVVTLQRPATDRPVWHALDEVHGPVAAPMGPAVDAGLRARTWLAEHSDDELLDVAWSCAPDVTEERHGRPGAEDPTVIVVRQGGGLGRAVRAGTLLAAYLGVADGELTARVALEAVATVLELNPADVLAEVVPQLRELVADGLLV
ncbi:methyltransferase [Terrabacter sp. NPDC000476]|uniref:DUF7059 domain-containing protein n=1 Tax=Terrabacter sp. NPDC000476 TaxID=3154258 RepID=UPI003318C61C